MNEAFYLPGGDGRYVSTACTRGPWDADAQHGGPPTALLATTMARCEPVGGQQLARLTFEILRPIPIAPVRVHARVMRPGKRVAFLEAVLTDDDGVELICARAWRIAVTPLDVGDPSPPPPPSSDAATDPDWFDATGVSFATTVDVRFVSGGFTQIGPATAWFRMLAPLIAGEPIEPVARVMVAADCANGISSVLDFSRYLFVNTDLSVSLQRLPETDWVALDAVTRLAPGGVSVAVSEIFDERGTIGRGSQTLYVAARRPSA